MSEKLLAFGFCPCYHLQNFMIEFRQPLLNTNSGINVPFSMAEIIQTMEHKLFHQKILKTILLTCQKKLAVVRLAVRIYIEQKTIQISSYFHKNYPEITLYGNKNNMVPKQLHN